MYRLIFVLILLGSTTGYTATVYKTVDENGVVSFSDIPPEGGASSEVLHITPVAPQATQEYLENLAAMRETTDRMASDRRKREQHRADLMETRARTASYQIPEQTSSPTNYSDYYPRYSGNFQPNHRIPFRPGFRPRPVHKQAGPLQRSGHNNSRSSNSQLMRPLVSTRP